MKTPLAFSPWILALGLAAGCGKPAAPEVPKAATPTAASPAKEAPADVAVLHGVIQDILADRSSLVIKHEEIPGRMRAMTMAFRVDAATLQAAQKGQAITGDVSNSGMNFLLSNVKLGPAPAPGAAPAAASPAADPSATPAMPMSMNMPMGAGMSMMPGMDMSMPAAPAPAAPATPPTPAAVPPAPEVLSAGAAIYGRTCIICHQPTGTGIPSVFPPLASSPIVDGDAQRLIRIVLSGLTGPVQVNGVTYNNVMPGHAPTLTDADIAAVLTYVRNSWGHTAPAVTASAVAAERALNRTAPWTWAELAGP